MSDEPINIDEKGDNVILNKDIAIFSLGDKEDLNFVTINDAFIEDYPLSDSFSLPELHVSAMTNHGADEIIVGAYAIRENMAYLLERKCTTKYKRSSDFPYQIVELLANKICPGKLTDLDLIALCDISLQSSAPGHAVYMMLDAIASGKMVINKPEDVYDFFFSKRIVFLDDEMDVGQALMTASKMATNHLLSYVQIETLSQEYQEWVLFTMSAGIGLRIAQPYFFLDMARGKRNKENAIFKYIAKNLGSPQMVNKLGKRFQLATDRPICRFEYLEAVREIERLLEYGERKCSLKPWCELNPDGAPTDSRCDNTPWKRCNDEQLCPYGLLWRHWKLVDYDVI